MKRGVRRRLTPHVCLWVANFLDRKKIHMLHCGEQRGDYDRNDLAERLVVNYRELSKESIGVDLAQ